MDVTALAYLENTKITYKIYVNHFFPVLFINDSNIVAQNIKFAVSFNGLFHCIYSNTKLSVIEKLTRN